MRGPIVWTAITLWSGALLAAAVSPAAATAPAAASAPTAATAATAAAPETRSAAARPPGPVLVDCVSNPDVRPADFILACGDGNSRLAGMRWSQWSPASAKAVGVNLVNDCKPYCAVGTFHAYAVTVRLDRPKPWKKYPQVQHFTRMTLTYTGNARPEGFPRVVTYPLWD
ncbi:hypothetical protein ABZX30_27785 [Streptomyces sp. NPDC004542]|uniref:hypothetical protein n=1 Tax=Streptomyces sp. NPDC004542 TaxID=3154281 RepID=UPI0033A7699C